MMNCWLIYRGMHPALAWLGHLYTPSFACEITVEHDFVWSGVICPNKAASRTYVSVAPLQRFSSLSKLYVCSHFDTLATSTKKPVWRTWCNLLVRHINENASVCLRSQRMGDVSASSSGSSLCRSTSPGPLGLLPLQLEEAPAVLVQTCYCVADSTWNITGMSNSEYEETLVTRLRRFGESTTVRGIPRALKSKDRGMVVLWSTAVVVCAGLLVWQVSTVLVRYYSRGTVTSVSEAGYNTVSTSALQGSFW